MSYLGSSIAESPEKSPSQILQRKSHLKALAWWLDLPLVLLVAHKVQLEKALSAGKDRCKEKSPDNHTIIEDKYISQVELRCKQRSNSYTCCRQGDCVHQNRFLYYKGAKCTINPCARFAFQFMCQICSNYAISPSCWFQHLILSSYAKSLERIRRVQLLKWATCGHLGQTSLACGINLKLS